MSNNSARCAACKYLRRRCSEDCILAPYFPSTHAERFACVHKIFGAGNVSRMLQQLPIQQRTQAADSISHEAYWRVRDPVYGGVGIISHLQEQIHKNQHELTCTQAQIAIYAAQNQRSERQVDPLPSQETQSQEQESLIFDQPFLDVYDYLPEFLQHP